MIKLRKIMWIFRAILYKFRFKSIGYASYLGRPLYLIGTNKASIGNKVRIFPGLRMEIHGKKGSIYISDNVSIGQNLHIISKNSSLMIGKNTTISANVFISNLDHDYSVLGVSMMDQNDILKDTIIGANCFIGYGAVILPGTKLGNNCIVGANAVLKGEYSDYSVIAGNPARVIKKYSSIINQWVKINSNEENKSNDNNSSFII